MSEAWTNVAVASPDTSMTVVGNFEPRGHRTAPAPTQHSEAMQSEYIALLKNLNKELTESNRKLRAENNELREACTQKSVLTVTLIKRKTGVGVCCVTAGDREGVSMQTNINNLIRENTASCQRRGVSVTLVDEIMVNSLVESPFEEARFG